ncbi:MAG: hypothetical protein K6E43_08105 [Lachnospiraceae bacterium]|nr:hypothetical protein [Lachnospiraceae bacterium]
MKNRRLKIAGLLTVATLMLGSTLMIGGCGKKAAYVPESVTDLQFDFETGEYSFNGVEGAKSYYVRIFDAAASDDEKDMPAAARRIRAHADQVEYTGAAALDDLKPGTTYNVYVYTYEKDENGDLVSSKCDPVTGVYKKAYETSDGTGLECVQEGTKITLNLTNDFFSEEYLDKEPQYLVKLYKDGQQVDEKTLGFANLEQKEPETSGDMGGFGGGMPGGMPGMGGSSVETTGKVEFTVDDASAKYTVTVTLISTNSDAYYNSEEGSPVEAGAPKPVEENTAGQNGEMSGFGEASQVDFAGGAPSGF